MPEEQDDTVLILGHTENEEPSLALVQDDGFVTVLEAYCDNYHIVTSTKSFSYRVEVFKNNELIDAIESWCNDLGTEGKDEPTFLKRYTLAHEKFKHELCKRKEMAPSEEAKIEQKDTHNVTPIVSSKKVESISTGFSGHGFTNIVRKLQKSFSLIKDTQGFRLAIVLFFVVVTVLGLGRFLMCQENIIDALLNKEEKVSYYTQIEPLCHKLEEGCLNLAQKRNVDEVLFTAKSCRGYCNSRKISLERCEPFLHHFKPIKTQKPLTDTRTSITPSIMKESKPEKIEANVLFQVLSPFQLTLEDIFPLSVQNSSMMACSVQVKNVKVNESEHDEIVQFSGGVAYLTLEAHETKRFKLFLEESYYRQFKKGKYTGSIDFSVSFDNGKKVSESKFFVFEVK